MAWVMVMFTVLPLPRDGLTGSRAAGSDKNARIVGDGSLFRYILALSAILFFFIVELYCLFKLVYKHLYSSYCDLFGKFIMCNSVRITIQSIFVINQRSFEQDLWGIPNYLHLRNQRESKEFTKIMTVTIPTEKERRSSQLTSLSFSNKSWQAPTFFLVCRTF